MYLCIYGSRHNARNHIHCLKLLKQQFARIRNFDIREISSIVASFAHVDTHRIIEHCNHSAMAAHVRLILVRAVIQTPASESRRPVRNGAIAFHLAKSKTAVARPALGRLTR